MKSQKDFLNYVKPSTRNNVWRASRSGVYKVVDTVYKDRFDNYVEYTRVESIDDVDDTPGSWYTNGTNIYIHSMDSQRVDNTIWALLSVRNLYVTGDFTVYTEGLNFVGGLDCVRIESLDLSKPI